MTWIKDRVHDLKTVRNLDNLVSLLKTWPLNQFDPLLGLSAVHKILNWDTQRQYAGLILQLMEPLKGMRLSWGRDPLLVCLSLQLVSPLKELYGLSLQGWDQLRVPPFGQFSPEGLGHLLGHWPLVQTLKPVGPPLSLAKLGQEILERVPNLSGKSLAILFMGLVRHPDLNVYALEFLDRAGQQPLNFQGTRDLCSFVWHAAKLWKITENAQVAQCVHWLIEDHFELMKTAQTSHDLSALSWGLAVFAENLEHLNLPVPLKVVQVLEALVTHLSTQPEPLAHMSCREMGSFFWGLSKVPHIRPPLFLVEQMGHRILRESWIDPATLGVLGYVLAAFQVWDPPVFAHLLKCWEPQQARDGDVRNMMFALAFMQRHSPLPEKIMRETADRVSQTLDSNPRQLISLLRSLNCRDSIRLAEPHILKVLESDHLRNRLEVADWTALIWWLARIGLVPSLDLQLGLMARLTVLAPQMSSVQLSFVVYGLSRLGIFFREWTGLVCRLVGGLGPIPRLDIRARLAYGLAQIPLEVPCLFETIAALVHQDSEGLQKSENWEDHGSVHQLMQASLTLNLEGGRPLPDWVPKFGQSLLMDVRPSHQQLEISRGLANYYRGVQNEAQIPELYTQVDIYVQSKNLVIELDGPTHHLRQLGGAAGSANGNTLWKARLLRHLGYQVINLEYSQRQSLNHMLRLTAKRTDEVPVHP